MSFKSFIQMVPELSDTSLTIGQRTIELLNALGIEKHLSGYSVLVNVIKVLDKNKNYINKISTKLFPTVLKEYYEGTNEKALERNVRHAIEVASRNPSKEWEELFGSEKPPVSTFLSRIFTAIDYVNS